MTNTRSTNHGEMEDITKLNQELGKCIQQEKETEEQRRQQENETDELHSKENKVNQGTFLKIFTEQKKDTAQIMSATESQLKEQQKLTEE